MPITSYAELKQGIIDYTKRSGNDILNKLDTFIDFAERDIWDALRVREMEARATASASTASRFLELPDGFIKMRQLQITLDTGLYVVPWHPLNSMSIDDTAGIPTRFTVTSQIEFNRVPGDDYVIEMDYWRQLTGLSSGNASNDILASYPSLYLACCLRHAFQWTMQEDQSEYWAAQAKGLISRANRTSRQGRYGPAPAVAMHGGMIV